MRRSGFGYRRSPGIGGIAVKVRLSSRQRGILRGRRLDLHVECGRQREPHRLRTKGPRHGRARLSDEVPTGLHGTMSDRPKVGSRGSESDSITDSEHPQNSKIPCKISAFTDKFTDSWFDTSKQKLIDEGTIIPHVMA